MPGPNRSWPLLQSAYCACGASHGLLVCVGKGNGLRYNNEIHQSNESMSSDTGLFGLYELHESLGRSAHRAGNHLLHQHAWVDVHHPHCGTGCGEPHLKLVDAAILADVHVWGLPRSRRGQHTHCTRHARVEPVGELQNAPFPHARSNGRRLIGR